jgi:taurine transport system permease protein
VPYPSTVWRAFVDVSTTHDGTRGYAGYLLWEHLYMTLRRVFVGVGSGVLLGLVTILRPRPLRPRSGSVRKRLRDS